VNDIFIGLLKLSCDRFLSSAKNITDGFQSWHQNCFCHITSGIHVYM